MKKLLVLVSLSCAIKTLSCSNQAIYESIQRANIQECEQQPLSQIEACKGSNRTSYEDYRRKRERLNDR